MSRHNFDFSVDKEVGIQLTERQLELREKRRRPLETHQSKSTLDITRHEPQSVASTTVVRADQRAFLKRVLASKKQTSGAKSVVTVSAGPSKSSSHLSSSSRVLASSKQQQQQSEVDSSTSSVASSAASSTVPDQKALLRNLLSKSASKANVAVHDTRMTDNNSKAMEVKPFNQKKRNKPSPEKPLDRDSHAEPRRSSSEASESGTLSPSSDVSAGYAEFLNVLKQEVAGDHTEVRC